MDYQNYDEYMRSVLGYSNMNCPSPYQNMTQPFDSLEGMFPDTYRVVYPMVVSACDMATMPITEEIIDNMTDNIYDRAVTDSRISIDINDGMESREEDNSRQLSDDFRQRRPRRRRNRFFRDLIRILLLRELLGRRQRFSMRPF